MSSTLSEASLLIKNYEESFQAIFLGPCRWLWKYHIKFIDFPDVLREARKQNNEHIHSSIPTEVCHKWLHLKKYNFSHYVYIFIYIRHSFRIYTIQQKNAKTLVTLKLRRLEANISSNSRTVFSNQIFSYLTFPFRRINNNCKQTHRLYQQQKKTHPSFRAKLTISRKIIFNSEASFLCFFLPFPLIFHSFAHILKKASPEENTIVRKERMGQGE